MAGAKWSSWSFLAGSSADRQNDGFAYFDSSASSSDRNVLMKPDEVRAALFCGCRVQKNTDQTGANYSSGSMVAWDFENYDTGGWHDNVTNNSRLTVPTGLGITKVLVIANLAIQNFTASTNALLIQLFKDGGYDGLGAVNPWPAGNATSVFVHVSGVAPCTGGDYFEVKLTCADTSIDIISGTSSFTIVAIG